MTVPHRGRVRLVKLSSYYRCMSIWILWRACLLRSRRHPFTDRAMALRGNIFLWRWKSDWTRHILSDIPVLGWPGRARGAMRRKWWNYPVVDWRTRLLAVYVAATRIQPPNHQISITSVHSRAARWTWAGQDMANNIKVFLLFASGDLLLFVNATIISQFGPFLFHFRSTFAFIQWYKWKRHRWAL